MRIWHGTVFPPPDYSPTYYPWEYPEVGTAINKPVRIRESWTDTTAKPRCTETMKVAEPTELNIDETGRYAVIPLKQLPQGNYQTTLESPIIKWHRR